MAHIGILTEVGSDGVGFIDCQGEELLYSIRLEDFGFGESCPNPEDLNGMRVVFDLKGTRVVDLALVRDAAA